MCIRDSIKAVDAARARETMPAHRDSAAAFVVDTHIGNAGGSGQTFDWDAWAHATPMPSKPWLLAGGLTPGNVGAALRRLRPYGVDVSSGVERARGVKDPELMRRFVAAVRAADTAAETAEMEG